MALVAYSDESDFSENDSEENLTNSINVKTVANSDLSNHAKSKSNLNENKVLNEIVDVEDSHSSTLQGPSRPESPIVPKLEFDGGGTEDTDIVNDVPTVQTWNVTNSISDAENSANCNVISNNTKKTKTNKLRLVLPALSQFDEDDDDDLVGENVAKDRMKPSNNGTGLFALLPKPRGSTHLVPQHVAARKRKRSPPPVTKRKAKPKPLPHIDNDSDEEGSSSVDFFSLSDSPLPTAPPAKSPLSSAAPLLWNSTTPTPVAPNNEPSPVACSESCQEMAMTVPVQTPTTAHHSGVDLERESNSSSSLSGIGEEALRRLAGRRNKGQVPTLIDINADDALMSREEWVTRTLCEEKPKKSFSRKKEGNPTQQQKRKHQITYLAHQAQEREQELQSAWGQNRFTKMQTQSKYGF